MNPGRLRGLVFWPTSGETGGVGVLVNDAQVWSIIAVLAATLVSMVVGMFTLFSRTMRAEFGTMRAEFGTMQAEFGTVRAEIGGLRSEMMARFEAVNARFDATDRRIDGLDRDIDAIFRIVGKQGDQV